MDSWGRQTNSWCLHTYIVHIHRTNHPKFLNKSCDSGEFLRTYCSAQASGPESHSSGSCKVVHKKTCWAGNLRCWWKVVWFYVWSCYCWWTKRKDISTFLKGSWHNDNGANIIPWEFFGTSTGRFAPRSGLSSHCWMVSSTSYRLIYSLPPLLLGRITSLLPHVSDYMTTCDLQDFAEDTWKEASFSCAQKTILLNFFNSPGWALQGRLLAKDVLVFLRFHFVTLVA